MTRNLNIDKLDKQILAILSKNARIPFLEVARECGVSGAAIHQRVNRLIDLGIITGSKFNIDPRKIGYLTCAYIGIFLKSAQDIDDVVKELENIPEITQCHYTTGEYGLFVKIYSENNEHLKSILVDKIQKIEGIARTETFISLEAIFNRELPV